MSFSTDVKSELCRLRLDQPSAIVAECYGILLFCHTFQKHEIRIITASPAFAERLPRLFQKAFSLRFDSLPPEGRQGKRSFCLHEEDKILSLLRTFGLDGEGLLSHHINLAILEETGAREAFVRGAFLAGGSVTDPEKRFHLELSTTHKSVSGELRSLLLDLDLDPRQALRGQHELLYFKKADQISDFLARIGAPVSAMSVMTAKVEREMRNTVTRQINCDSANAGKTVSAAMRQTEAIRLLVRRAGLDSLPEPLRSAALLRLTNPEASLSDLALLSRPPVSRSCLSYRLNRIIRLSEKQEAEESPENI